MANPNYVAHSHLPPAPVNYHLSHPHKRINLSPFTKDFRVWVAPYENLLISLKTGPNRDQSLNTDKLTTINQSPAIAELLAEQLKKILLCIIIKIT